MHSRVIVARYRYDCSPYNGSDTIGQTIESAEYDEHRNTGAIIVAVGHSIISMNTNAM